MTWSPYTLNYARENQMNKAKDITGQKFGRLIAKKYIHKDKRSYWECECSCGNSIAVRIDSLIAGKTMSCGCLTAELRKAKAKEKADQFKPIERNNNMLSRACRECNVAFLGGPHAWYCPECRESRKRKAKQQHYERKRKGMAVKIGDAMMCEMCGEKIIRNSGVQRFCPKCADLHLKMIDNQQSLEWKKKNPEKAKEANKKMLAYRAAYDEAKDSGIVGIIWSKDRRKWRVRPYDLETKKQFDLGTFSDLDQAMDVLEKWKNKNN